MPDLLLVCRDHLQSLKIEELARTREFRLKSTFSPDVALEWISLKNFDVAFVEASVEPTVQRRIADAIWARNSLAPTVIFDFAKSERQDLADSRLHGAEIVTGEGTIAQLDAILLSVDSRVTQSAADFKIMVVEDLDSPRDIICAYVESVGFPYVTGFSSVQLAIAELERDPSAYSCVITDIRMPELGGKELIQMIRMHDKLQHLPIIVLTAHGTVDCLVDCLRVGASGFLVKPPKRADLEREIARARRIYARKLSPRLASFDEADQFREILAERGMI